MNTIIHISADFPDPLDPTKTKAVENLIAAAHGFRHVVYSLNRVNWQNGIATMPFAEDRIALAYGAPPFGVGLTRYLKPVTDFIFDDLKRRGIAPDLFHAHKFSVEGLVAADLAQRCGSPFIASLWGNTDVRIVETKWGLRQRYRAIARKAALLLPAAPWTADHFAMMLKLDRSKFEILPIMTAADAILPPEAIQAPRLLGVFGLDGWRSKGLDMLIRAAALLEREFPGLVIDIYGRGGARSLFDITRRITAERMQGRVRLMGPLQHGAVQQTMNTYAGFVMPTRLETYGMVHVEALLAGIPILWSKGRGVDGLFRHLDVGYRCDPSSIDDIVAGVTVLITQESPLKQRIAAQQQDGTFEPLRRAGIAVRYRDVLARHARQTPRVS